MSLITRGGTRSQEQQAYVQRGSPAHRSVRNPQEKMAIWVGIWGRPRPVCERAQR